MEKYTREQWFSLLPHDIRDKANNNTIKQYGEEGLKKKDNTFSESLESAFVWIDTEEGFLFWNEINDKSWGTPIKSPIK